MLICNLSYRSVEIAVVIVTNLLWGLPKSGVGSSRKVELGLGTSAMDASCYAKEREALGGRNISSGMDYCNWDGVAVPLIAKRDDDGVA